MFKIVATNEGKKLDWENESKKKHGIVIKDVTENNVLPTVTT